MVTGKINHSQVILVGFFSLVNALINPILYGKMSQRYRKGYVYIFKKILSVCGREKPDASFFGKFACNFITTGVEIRESNVPANRAYHRLVPSRHLFILFRIGTSNPTHKPQPGQEKDWVRV